ncbi:MAG: hypothetical protein WCK54_21150, partial [Desulfuromonadales bacterium]
YPALDVFSDKSKKQIPIPNEAKSICLFKDKNASFKLEDIHNGVPGSYTAIFSEDDCGIKIHYLGEKTFYGGTSKDVQVNLKGTCSKYCDFNVDKTGHKEYSLIGTYQKRTVLEVPKTRKEEWK